MSKISKNKVKTNEKVDRDKFHSHGAAYAWHFAAQASTIKLEENYKNTKVKNVAYSLRLSEAKGIALNQRLHLILFV